MPIQPGTVDRYKLKPDEAAALEAFAANNSDGKAARAVNSAYWRIVEEMMHERASSRDAGPGAYPWDRELVDFGIIDRSLIDTESKAIGPVDRAIAGAATPSGKTYYFSHWIERQYNELLNYDRRRELERKSLLREQELKRLEDQIGQAQCARNEAIAACPGDNRAGYAAGRLMRMEQLKSELLVYQKEVKRGVFMSLDRRREQMKRLSEYGNIETQTRRFISDVSDKQSAVAIRKLNEEIMASIEGLVDGRDELRRIVEEQAKISSEASALSQMEIDSRMDENLRYLRDLVRLSAHRVHADTMSVLYGACEAVTAETIRPILDRIDEFDPRLFKNGRVALFGRPNIVIIPGRGNGLFDWKNNSLVIPVVPAQSVEVAVISAVVEYRMDVDEDKKMSYSYNQIKDYEEIRSARGLRERFVKDYTIWMVSEYRGFKILPKTVRSWFEFEIGPNKNDLMTPLKLAPHLLSAKEYETLFSDLKAKTGAGSASASDWYDLGVILGRREEWPGAEAAFRNSAQLEPGLREAVYNLGFVCARLMKKQDAVDAFSRYIKLNPASWWAGVAREHLMRLR